MALDTITAALITLSNQAATREIFSRLVKRLGQSGWELAKQSDKTPQETEEALKQLLDIGVVKSDESGLEGNYGLTPLGFEVKERLQIR